jgi:hypothetical protein
MIAGSGFAVLAGRKRIPPRVTPEPGKLTSYRPGSLTVVMSVSTGVHPAAAKTTSSRATVLGIDWKSYYQTTVYAGGEEVKKREIVSDQAGG